MAVRRLIEILAAGLALTLFGAICLSWTVLALPLLILLPARAGAWAGRRTILACFGLFVQLLGATRIYRFDLEALKELRSAPAVVLAPNHPSLIDAIVIIAHDASVSCVLKSQLMNNVFLGAGARLARYIRNYPPRRMISEAVAELRRGGKVLLFPEGTRTEVAPINDFNSSVALIAKHANVAVQTLIIEQDRPCLCKGWALLRFPTLPITYRIRIGRRFAPPADAAALTNELERYFRGELADSTQNQWLDDLPNARRLA